MGNEADRGIAAVLLNGSILPWLIVLFLLLLIPAAAFTAAHWSAVSPNGSEGALWGLAFLLTPSLIAAGLLIPVALVLIVFERTRRSGLLFGAFCACYVITGIVGRHIGRRIRMAPFRSLAERSDTLVAAITAFDRDHDAPPSSLADLVPDYLPKVPSTRLSAYPEYEYVAGKAARNAYDGNPWALLVDTDGGGPGWFILVYLPAQNYSDVAPYDSSVEHIGQWAYIMPD
jgi:hypothetical protein